jgi:hypothetical protein
MGQVPSTSLVALTFDVDWAPEFMLEDLLLLLAERGLKGTVFTTHRSEAVANVDPEMVEVGLHPNFNDCRGEFEAPLRALREIYPQAIGVRSHSLYESSHILQLFVKHGLLYECNTLMPWHDRLHPVTKVPGLLSIPFYWEDDTHFILGRHFAFREDWLREPGQKVFNFHPVHLFMNTRSAEHYGSYRTYLTDEIELRKHIDYSIPGIRTLFLELVDYLVAQRIPTYRLCDIYERFRPEVGRP